MERLTENTIKGLKIEHGSCYEFEVAINDDGEKAYCYLKKPSIQALAIAEQFNKDRYKYLEVLLNDCWLKGDERIKTDDEAKYTTMLHCDSLFQLRECSLKKL